MANEDRTTIDRVAWLSHFQAAAPEFDLHAAMRHLECIFRESPRWGEAVHPTEEPVRFEQEPLMGFAAAPLGAFHYSEEGPHRLVNTIFGLFGPQGPLPLHLTEHARDRVRNAADPTFVAFGNLFHHRLFTLFYRAWAITQPTVAQDRPEGNRFGTYVGSLCGLAQAGMRNRDGIDDETKLHYAGRLACPSRNAAGLEDIVGDYFQVPAEVEEFVGEWVPVPKEAQWHLGGARDASTLARSTLLGARTWLCDHKFRLTLGPLMADEFAHFLPGRAGLRRLSDVVRMYVGDEFSWDVRLVLAPDQRNRLCLNGKSQLGWHARVGMGGDEDLVVDPRLGRTVRTPRKTRSKLKPGRRATARAKVP